MSPAVAKKKTAGVSDYDMCYASSSIISVVKHVPVLKSSTPGSVGVIQWPLLA